MLAAIAARYLGYNEPPLVNCQRPRGAGSDGCIPQCATIQARRRRIFDPVTEAGLIFQEARSGDLQDYRPFIGSIDRRMRSIGSRRSNEDRAVLLKCQATLTVAIVIKCVVEGCAPPPGDAKSLQSFYQIDCWGELEGVADRLTVRMTGRGVGESLPFEDLRAPTQRAALQAVAAKVDWG
jgi:hypothetical protein